MVFRTSLSRTPPKRSITKVSKISIISIIERAKYASPPDDLGLMISETGRTYIKIHERYVPLVYLHKEKQRYHLVKTIF